MRILFITGSLAAGWDGVADYTLRVAGALREQGLEVKLLSWSEKGLKFPEVEKDSLRLPANFPLRAKLERAREFIGSAPPDRISLQFVPYAFGAYGLPFGLADEISSLIGKTPLHIFAHELWVMPCMGCSWKAKLVGTTLQKKCVLDFFKKLRPYRISTTLPLYQDALTKAGFPNVTLEPLAGNIIPRDVRYSRPVNERRLGFFGTIFPSAPIEKLCGELLCLQADTKLSFTLFSAGNISAEMVKRWEKLKENFGHALRFERLGHLAPGEVSYYFHSLDFFLSPYSPTFWRKSSSIAVAREHAKPVILVSPSEVKAQQELPVGVYDKLTSELLISPPVLSSYNPLSSIFQTYA